MVETIDFLTRCYFELAAKWRLIESHNSRHHAVNRFIDPDFCLSIESVRSTILRQLNLNILWPYLKFPVRIYSLFSLDIMRIRAFVFSVAFNEQSRQALDPDWLNIIPDADPDTWCLSQITSFKTNESYRESFSKALSWETKKKQKAKTIENLTESRKFYLNSIQFHLINKFPLSVQP